MIFDFCKHNRINIHIDRNYFNLDNSPYYDDTFFFLLKHFAAMAVNNKTKIIFYHRHLINSNSQIFRRVLQRRVCHYADCDNYNSTLHLRFVKNPMKMITIVPRLRRTSEEMHALCVQSPGFCTLFKSFIIFQMSENVVFGRFEKPMDACRVYSFIAEPLKFIKGCIVRIPTYKARGRFRGF